MDVETDVSNPEVMDIISQVLQNFNPLKEEEQDSAVFAATFKHFERKGRRHRYSMRLINADVKAKLKERERKEVEERLLH